MFETTWSTQRFLLAPMDSITSMNHLVSQFKVLNSRGRIDETQSTESKCVSDLVLFIFNASRTSSISYAHTRFSEMHESWSAGSDSIRSKFAAAVSTFAYWRQLDTW